MIDHEGFASNETLIQALFACAEFRPDEDAASNRRLASSSETNHRAGNVSERSLGRPPAAVMQEEEAQAQLANDFVGRIIQEYERILERGLPPSRAIASVVGWASSECERIRS
jgi:hypothetical protein